jgi:hypothetical protein
MLKILLNIIPNKRLRVLINSFCKYFKFVKLLEPKVEEI